MYQKNFLVRIISILLNWVREARQAIYYIVEMSTSSDRHLITSAGMYLLLHTRTDSMEKKSWNIASPHSTVWTRYGIAISYMWMIMVKWKLVSWHIYNTSTPNAIPRKSFSFLIALRIVWSMYMNHDFSEWNVC